MKKLLIIGVIALMTSSNVHAIDAQSVTRAMTDGLMSCQAKLKYGYNSNCKSCTMICGNALKWVADSLPNPDPAVLNNWFDQCARHYERCNR